MTTIAQQLRDELRAAHTIVRNGLGVMTMGQKCAWGCENRLDGVDGVTRATERQEVIDGGSPLAMYVELRRADRIIANAWGIQSLHQHALWATANWQDGVVTADPTRQGARTAALSAAVDAAHELVGDARGTIANAVVAFVQSRRLP
ncbi:hypothetical protein [Burkholderia sp. Ac-20392]|uniref:hypothetical protein n=1 Tax=Burkholderia sp. Ac-20392 TaxID=2703905 RepID=UPI00197FA290|nr:hypothetical protein [Burkholderia sp. Ac-20392]MBN3794370.1 hypothetical protein [Burkholderia sp. Ac-20392]